MRLLLIKLLALFSFLGGPLYLSDLLRASAGQKPAFAIAFAPVALLIVGALALKDDMADRLSRVSVGAGLVGALLLTIENGLAAWDLLVAGLTHPNQTMILFGILVGVPASIAYAHLALQLLHRPAPGKLVR